MAHALAMLVAIPVPAERASRVLVDTPHALLHTSQPGASHRWPSPTDAPSASRGLHSRDELVPQQLDSLR